MCSSDLGIKLGYSRAEMDSMNAAIDAAWRESVEEEVNRRLAQRGLTEVPQADMGQQQMDDGRTRHLLLTSK